MAARKMEAASVNIPPPKFSVLEVVLVGTAPYVSNSFPEKAREQMRDKMLAGSNVDTKKKKREPKDFQAGYQGSMHKATTEGNPPKPVKGKGWYGIPATAFRAACIRACTLVGVPMTMAKMCVFILADGYDKDGQPLVKITKGEPEYFEAYTRNADQSPNLTARGKWAPGWECVLRVRFDSDFITASNVANLIMRAGIGVGIGAGRPFSTNSVGMGWGTFEPKDPEKAAKKAA